MSGARQVVVTGASSQIGVFLLPRLLDPGRAVLALSRRTPLEGASSVEGLRWVRPDSPDIKRPAALISCGPIGLAADRVAAGHVTGRAIVFSTSSVRTKRDSANRAEREKVAAIAAAERRLADACRQRGIALALIRPTLIYGCGLDGNLSLLLQLGERFGLIPVSRRANGLRQPVHADDLARLAVSALDTDFGPFLEGEAPGGETLTYRAMAEKVAACGSRSIRVVGLPEALLGALVRGASAFGPWQGLNPEMVRRQAEDMVFDGTTFASRFDWTPRPFAPTPQDFQVPPNLAHYRSPLETNL